MRRCHHLLVAMHMRSGFDVGARALSSGRVYKAHITTQKRGMSRLQTGLAPGQHRRSNAAPSNETEDMVVGNAWFFSEAVIPSCMRFMCMVQFVCDTQGAKSPYEQPYSDRLAAKVLHLCFGLFLWLISLRWLHGQR